MDRGNLPWTEFSYREYRYSCYIHTESQNLGKRQHTHLPVYTILIASINSSRFSPRISAINRS